LHVGLENMRDAHPLLCGGFEIRLDLGLWIHHSAAGFAASAEEVAGAAGFGSEELAEDHGALLCDDWVDAPTLSQAVVDRPFACAYGCNRVGLIPRIPPLFTRAVTLAFQACPTG
jgi:hypothetical protein